MEKIKNTEHYLRLNLLNIQGATPVLQSIVLKIASLTHGKTADNFLKSFKSDLRGVIAKESFNILFPVNGTPTDVGKWDVTVATTVLLHCCTLERKRKDMMVILLREMRSKEFPAYRNSIENYLKAMIGKLITVDQYKKLQEAKNIADLGADLTGCIILICGSAISNDALYDICKNILIEEIEIDHNSKTSLQIYLNTKKGNIESLKQDLTIFDEKFKQLYADNGSNDLTFWDKNLLVLFVLHSCERIKPASQVELKKIRQHRNEMLAHKGKAELTSGEFLPVWTDLFGAIKTLLKEENMDLNEFEYRAKHFKEGDLDIPYSVDIRKKHYMKESNDFKILKKNIGIMEGRITESIEAHQNTMTGLLVNSKEKMRELASVLESRVKKGTLADFRKQMEISYTTPVTSNVVPHIFQHYEPKQETAGDSGDLVEVTVHNKDGDTKPVSSIVVQHIVQNNESKQETGRDSGYLAEVNVQNKNEDAAPVSSIVVPIMVLNNESEQETGGDSGESADVNMQNKDGDTKPVSSIVVQHIVQNNESKQETGGDSGDLAEVNVQNKNEDAAPVSSIVVPDMVLNNESEQETGGDSGESAEVNMQNKDGEMYTIPIGGSMRYYPEKLLGQGSFGVVYEGRSGVYKNKPVAVKKVVCLNDQEAKELLNINKEIRTLETLDTTAGNTHIIRFIDSYIKKNTVYLAFELAIGTLVDYVSPSNASWRKSLTGDGVIRGIVSGLNYSHKKSIIHRDLKPGNIFIVEYSDSGLKAVIGDFGHAKAMTGNTLTSTRNFGSFGYIAPEIWKAMSDTEMLSSGTKCNKASDIFSLGLVTYYAISLGKHPFGNKMTAQVSISNGHIPTFDNISFAYEDMFEGMLNVNPDDRPTIEEVYKHPALWTADIILNYFKDKSDAFENMIKEGTIKDNLLDDPLLIPGGDWMNLLPVNLQAYLRKYKVNTNKIGPTLYSGKKSNVRYFLRCIRNTIVHYKVDYPTNTHAELGTFPDGHVELWLTVCPKLLMHVYTKLGPP